MAIDYISLYPHVFYFISRYFDLWTMCHHFCLVKSSRLMAKPLFFTMFLLNTKRVAHQMTSLKLFMFCRSRNKGALLGSPVKGVMCGRYGRGDMGEQKGRRRWGIWFCELEQNPSNYRMRPPVDSLQLPYFFGWILWFMVDNWGAPSSISIYIYICSMQWFGESVSEVWIFIDIQFMFIFVVGK